MDRRNFLRRGACLSAGLLLPLPATAQRSREIVVAQSADLSGVQQNMGRDYFTGAKLAFDQSNAKGGVAGRRWRHVVLDDAGVPARAVENMRKQLSERQADCLFGS